MLPCPAGQAAPEGSMKAAPTREAWPAQKGGMMNTAPQRLGPYQLHKRLARGGMGEVWKAFDPHLRRYVAIKLLLADLRNDPDFVTRFGREAQLVASLRHPNIVP